MGAFPIPYQRQQIVAGGRACGAAALAMVYQSFGMDCRQEDIWDRIAEEVRPNERVCRTHRLAEDALRQGLSAAILQAAFPIGLLRRMAGSGARIVLNHRLDAGSALGHFTVLVKLDREEVVLHDPHFGAGRSLPLAELEQLWKPIDGACEIVGGVLLAIGPEEKGPLRCEDCGAPLPAALACGRCHRPIALAPAEALGCLDRRCPNRRWDRLYCPSCDWAPPFDKPGGTI